MFSIQTSYTIAIPLYLTLNTPMWAKPSEPTSALAYQQTTNTRIVVEENHLRFYTGGEERMTIDANGNVGIGNVHPNSTLDITGRHHFEMGWASSTALYLRGDGNTLGKDWTSIRFHGTDGNAIIRLAESEQNRGLQFGVNDGLGENMIHGLVINGNGNVGIGTTNPGDYKLNVNGNLRTTTYADIGLTRPAGAYADGLFVKGTDGNYASIQLATKAWSGSHAILFNAYKSDSQVNGGLSTTGNTRFTHNVSSYSGGAGSIMYFGNGGIMRFYVSQASTGADTDVNWGTAKMQIQRNGTVGINTNDPDETYVLHVNGKAYATSFHTSANTYADFVFEDSYRLAPLSEVEQYIEQNHHLPDIPSESEAKANGIDLQEMQSKLLQKIEELTLYVIDLEKQMKELKSKVN